MPVIDRVEAICHSNKDPAKAGRIQAAVAEMDGAVYPHWIDPIFPAGEWICIPEPGDAVELELPDGTDIVEFPTDVKYLGKRLSEGNSVPTEFKTNYPNRRGFRTKQGHLIIADDKAGTLTIKNGKSGIVVEFDSTGLLHLGVTVGTDFIMKGTTFNTENATMLGGISAYVTLVGTAMTKMAQDPFLSGSLQAATIAAMTAAGTAGAGTATGLISAFLAKAATWLSTKVKTG